jgi:type IV pilus assembly protein PilM
MNFRTLTNPRALRSPIGIDVGRRAVKAVQLERVGKRSAGAGALGGWRVAATAVMTRADGASGPMTPTEVRQFAAALDRKSFLGNDVVLAAPDGLLSSVLELPPMSGDAPIELIARIELARTHKCPPDSFEMGYWDLPTVARAQKATTVMAVALPHAACDPVLDAFDLEGLNVCGVDVRSCALARACAGLTDTTGFNALVDLGAASAELILLFRGAVIYTRSLPEAGIHRLRDAVAARLKVEREVAEYLLSHVGLAGDDAAGDGEQDVVPSDLPADGRSLIVGHFDAIAQELAASFSYAVHQYRDAAVSRLLVVGGGGGVPGVAQHLTAATGIEAAVASPATLAALNPTQAETCASPSMTAALGLALYPEY